MGEETQITSEQLRHLARLARLEVTPAEERQLLQDMERIIGFVAKIKELNLEGSEPLIHPVPSSSGPRQDTPEPPLPRDAVLNNAPRADSDYFRVPKVLEK
ncbi:MAG: Asp-tRNA(Asn)/Glu-tRNA(Gln) amidotransferase subunit GatC [Flavobacteriales bacterium]|nr:Asp-tRNA(Asn)/Glu-tRNA(Gln) amidotransferase subunit GatC [Flavobacteriales bacterium]MCX7767510.1 Asp-tRNA(Asn)/Glu-tRNA(Gln) amidotransferase subunit GatC [Flavobacteriales bacterium]MDW8409645.1 Asp-tRNA(Asn)/Glu-tRNA(Gln) amidotransferase subunit GatC [Flavobacteriales bacterium]